MGFFFIIREFRKTFSKSAINPWQIITSVGKGGVAIFLVQNHPELEGKVAVPQLVFDLFFQSGCLFQHVQGFYELPGMNILMAFIVKPVSDDRLIENR